MKERLLPSVIGLVASLSLFAICAWLWVFAGRPLSPDAEQWAFFGSYLGGILSPLLAAGSLLGLFLTLRHQQKEALRSRQEANDQQYLKHALQSYERAYAALAPEGTEAAPRKDRIAWLTCARLLRSAHDAAGKISEESTGLRTVHEGENAYWRHCFYKLLNPTALEGIFNNSDYFRRCEVFSEKELEESSVRVIWEFVKFKGEDPLQHVEYFSEEELNNMRVHEFALKECLLARRQKRQARSREI